jgi:hypothetical protein
MGTHIPCAMGGKGTTCARRRPMNGWACMCTFLARNDFSKEVSCGPSVVRSAHSYRG